MTRDVGSSPAVGYTVEFVPEHDPRIARLSIRVSPSSRMASLQVQWHRPTERHDIGGAGTLPLTRLTDLWRALAHEIRCANRRGRRSIRTECKYKLLMDDWFRTYVDIRGQDVTVFLRSGYDLRLHLRDRHDTEALIHSLGDQLLFATGRLPRL